MGKNKRKDIKAEDKKDVPQAKKPKVPIKQKIIAHLAKANKTDKKINTTLINSAKKPLNSNKNTKSNGFAKPVNTIIPKTNVIKQKLTPLQEQMQKKLKGAKFRMINEMLYTSSGDNAFSKFQESPSLYQDYHDGFRAQVQGWPTNPLHFFIEDIKKASKPGLVVADMGCGEAELSLEVSSPEIKVHSFDLVAGNDRITACDIAHTPLPDRACDIVIFCLSLMGTNYSDFITEADRILKPYGLIKIAEVKSRFEDVEQFCNFMIELGYKLTLKDDENKMFVLLEFKKGGSKSKVKKGKESKPTVKDVKAPILKPCIYKRR